MKYRARTNGNIVELSDEAAAKLVPAIYEPVSEPEPVPDTDDGQSKPRKPRR